MTKDLLQQELLEKVKEGVKPSDLKKLKKIKVNQDEGYESDRSDKSIPVAPPLPNSLQNQITALKKQLQVYQDFKEADLKIKENYKKTIEQLQQENKSLKEKPAKLETSQPSLEETKPITFTCSSCSGAFNFDLIRLVKKSGKQICRNCTLLMLKRANQLTGQRIVLKKKSLENPAKTFTCQTCQQSSPGEPHQAHITNFQEQGINPRQLTSVCSTCLNEKVILADFYCPRTSEGRDTYNPKEPQFDCDCPTSQAGGKV